MKYGDLIDRQAAIDTIRELESDEDFNFNNGLICAMNNIAELPSAQPDLDEWCTDCKEYDKERNSCPRWNRVIRETLKDLQEERKTQLSEENTTSNCISRQAAIDALDGNVIVDYIRGCADRMRSLPSAQPETAKRIVGKSRDGMTLWYQCDMCNEPVDVQDNYCRRCGRRLTDG